jgi:ABC-type multidrug transport system fused ATPase/permease subunit
LRLSLGYVRPYLGKQAEIVAYMLLGLAYNATFPLFTRTLLDDAIPASAAAGDVTPVLRLLAAMGLAFAVSLLAQMRQAYLNSWIGSAVIADLRASLHARLQALPTAWHHRHDQGDVLARLFSDVVVVEEALTCTLRDGLMHVLTLAVSAAVMASISVPLTLVVLAAVPLVAFLYRRMAAGAQQRGLAVQEDTADLMGVAAENHLAQPVVKVFGLEAREAARFGRLSGRLFRSERRLSLYGGVFSVSVGSVMTVLRLAILGLGAWLIVEGRFTVGGLVALVALMGDVLGPVTALTGTGQRLQAATGSLARIDEVRCAPVEDAGVGAGAAATMPSGPVREGITFDHVDFAYDGGPPVVRDLTLTIPAGHRVAFVGPSGAGKSTILALLLRLHDPVRGAVRIDGTDLAAVPAGSMRRRMGVVLQDSFLFDTTIRANIALGRPGATDEQVLAAARAAGVDAFAPSLARGYDTVVGPRGARLSGGQRQRVALARALVRDPAILVLDEATAGLDPATERAVDDTITRLAPGRIVVTITHRLAATAGYDRIHVLHGGRIVEQGTHGQLLRAGGLYARLWAEQGAPRDEFRARARSEPGARPSGDPGGTSHDHTPDRVRGAVGGGAPAPAGQGEAADTRP